MRKGQHEDTEMNFLRATEPLVLFPWPRTPGEKSLPGPVNSIPEFAQGVMLNPQNSNLKMGLTPEIMVGGGIPYG